MSDWIFVGYCRVSKKEQDENSNALTQQKHRVASFGVNELFVDVQSGSRDDRPEFQRMFQMVESGSRFIIVITRLDRITRDALTSLQILRMVERGQVKLIVLDMGREPVDLDNPTIWDQLATSGIRSAYEVKQLSRRVKSGLEYLRGQKKAPPSIPFGYMRVDEKYQLSTRPWKDTGLTESEVARKCVEAFLRVRTLSGTANVSRDNWQKTWWASTLNNWLRNPVLQGHTAYFWQRQHKKKSPPQIHYNTHEALITRMEAEAIASILDSNRGMGGRNASQITNPLRGLVYCGACGSRRHVNVQIKKKRTYEYLICGGRTDPAVRCVDNRIRLEVVEAAVVEALIKRAEDAANLTISILPQEKQPDPELMKLEAKLQQYRLMAVQFGEDEILRKAIAQVQAEISDRQSFSDDNKSAKENLELLFEAISSQDFWNWSEMEDRQKQDIFRLFVDRVVVRDRQVVAVDLKF